MGQRTKAKSSLRHDTDGAVMVIAVFMSAFLVGCLWYIVGVGDAIMYKQNMSAGADATAYVGAVYNARGMNVIALLNIIMVAVVVVLIAAQVLKMIAAMVNVAAIITCNLPNPPLNGGWACTYIGQSKAYWEQMNALINGIENEGDALMVGLSESQVEIAKAVPWIAHKRGTGVAATYQLVSESYVISNSMQPTGDRLGLPVVEEDFKIACDRAKELVPSVVYSTIPLYFYAFLGNWMIGMYTDMLVWEANNIPDKLCTGGGASMNDYDFFDSDSLCEKTELAKKTKKEDCTEAADDSFDDHEEGDEDETEEVINDVAQPISDAEKTTKGMYGPAVNGNDYFQVYGFAQGVPDWLDGASGGLEVASWGGAQVAAAGDNSKVKVSMAEFYYDQRPGVVNLEVCLAPNNGACGMPWPQHVHSVLYNMRWRARLRHARLPTAGVDINVFGGGISPPPDISGDLTDPGVLANLNNNMGSYSQFLQGTFTYRP